MEFRRLFDIPLFQLLHFSQKAALSVRVGIHKKPYSSQDCLDEIMCVSAGAIEKGLSRGDRVAIITHSSRPEWTFLDFGLQQIGIIPVPISPAHDDNTLTFILNDAAVQLVIVDNRLQYNRLQHLSEQVKSIKNIFTFESYPDIPSWDDFLTNPEAKHLEEYETTKAAIHEDDIATIVYTSGALMPPKGVMLTHKNLVSNVKSLLKSLPLKASHTVISILPQHYIFERLIMYAYWATGVKIFYLSWSDSLLEDIKNIKPHYFSCNSLTIKSFYEQLIDTSKKDNTWFFWALKQGRNYGDYGKLSLFYFFKLKLADLLVFRHWRKAFGGKIEGIMLGLEAISPSLARLFTAAGIDIREGYGMIETSANVAINRFESHKVNFGTVGQVIDGVSIKIVEPKDEYGNGEIYIKGDSIMKGYWNHKNLTLNCMEDGWFKTGDLGRFTNKKAFLQIAGRKKDSIYLSSNETLNPAFIERQLLNSPYVADCIVLGDGRPFAVALIVPYYTNIHLFALQNKLNFGSKSDTITHLQIVELFRNAIQQINSTVSPRERIGKFQLLDHEWSIESGEFTAMHKKNRTFILNKYKELIDNMYTGS